MGIRIEGGIFQAIVAYHAGRKVDAKNFLGMAEEEARMMRIEPEKLTQSEHLSFCCRW